MPQSKWDEHDIETKVHTILREIPDSDLSHHLGRAFLSAYQLAIEFQRRYPEAAAGLGFPVGGSGIGQHNSLAQYLAQQLSSRLHRGTLPNIEGGFLSNQHLRTIAFNGPDGAVESSLTGTGFTLTLFRLR
jgi:hypothetical protein